MRENPQKYCILILRRIAYFFAIHLNLELVRMHAEFMKDDNGKIWFIFAKNTSVRKLDT